MRSKGWLFNSLVALAASVMLCAGSPALPQSYPSQPIRIIVPTAPGGVADIAARTLAQGLNEIGKTAVVENRTGGGGAIAAEFVAKSAPDGYTVYVGFHATQAILPHLQKLSYDAEKDFAPVTVAVKSANILVVNPSVPALSLKDLVVYAKANPGKLTFASQGNGSSGHIVGEQLKQAAGIDIVHVPYRGGAPAVQDLIAGHVSMMFDILTLAMPQVKEPTRSVRLRSPRRNGMPCSPASRQRRRWVSRNSKAAPGSASSFRRRRRVRPSIGSMPRRRELFQPLKTASVSLNRALRRCSVPPRRQRPSSPRNRSDGAR